METPLDQLDSAIAAGTGVLANVEPEQMDGRCPCESWDVRQLLNHMIRANNFFVTTMGGAPIAEDGTDFTSGDYRQAFDDASAAARAAFAAPGALEKASNCHGDRDKVWR